MRSLLVLVFASLLGLVENETVLALLLVVLVVVIEHRLIDGHAELFEEVGEAARFLGLCGDGQYPRSLVDGSAVEDEVGVCLASNFFW